MGAAPTAKLLRMTSALLSVTLSLTLSMAVSTPAAALLPPSAEAAWAPLTYDAAAFDEVVSLVREVHLTGKIPQIAWVKAANGALRVLRPKVRLTARTLLDNKARRTLRGRAVRRLPCLDARWVLLARGPRPRPDSTAALRRLRAERRAARKAEAVAFARLPFGRKDLACVMSEIERTLPTVAGLPAAATQTVTPAQQARRRAWRLATNHLLKALDPHAVVIPNKLLERLDDESGGTRRVGVGLELGARRGRTGGAAVVEIVRVHRGGPAAKAGLRPGDEVLRIDDHAVAGWSATRLDDALAGPAGSVLRLDLRRRTARPRQWTVRLTRAPVRRSTVTGRRQGPRGELLVMRLPVFASGAAADVSELLAQLRAASRQQPRAVVMDLRGNTGGWVKEAVGIVDAFLARGEIVRVRQRDEPDQVYAAHRAKGRAQRLMERLPLVLLVDSACRSSCELLADALQAHGRAVVVGAQTYGKGTVQGVFEAERGPWSLFITIARYHGPDGGSVQARGVTPDLPLPGVKRGGFREANYSAALTTVAGDPKRRAGPTARRSAHLKHCLRRARHTPSPWLDTLNRRDPALADALRVAWRCAGPAATTKVRRARAR